MLHCPSCAAEVPGGSRFCLACGASIAAANPGDAATETVHVKLSSHPSSGIDEGRFPAGTLLSGRYRILGLLGRGGMGEVYRANDMKLGQPVALKFLGLEAAGNAGMLARLNSEVRLARQVSHPNVCRVYDVGEADGAPFLTMEYVDGEDLGSLLRRIGRLPGDKGVEIARRICAGLAAAHDKGVLHRDLKPANVMIDGRGQVLLTDFGLAGVAGQIEGAEIRNGTPAYMAPEQLAGKEVTVRSDIYSLGLVMYQMFTGKRAFENARREVPASVSTLVKDIDPAVEAVIARCLEADPRKRPSSALAVAAALPGGDPLAAALAAGETPSPEMVAASGEGERISIRTAVVCLAAVVAGMAGVAMLSPHVTQWTSVDHSPEVLTQKAREIVQRFGYTDKPADFSVQFLRNTLFGEYAAKKGMQELYLRQIARAQPPPLVFSYRQSPNPLLSYNADALVTRFDPPPVVPGMVRVELDGLGRMIYFDAVPPQFEDGPAAPAAPFDWNRMFEAAGLEAATFTATDPKWLPLVSFDARAAWTGSYPGLPQIPLRIEAAAWKGRPVYFQIILPWTASARGQTQVLTTTQTSLNMLSLSLIIVTFATALALAWRSCRMGRADMGGASRVGLFLFCLYMFAWVFSAHHVGSFYEFGKFVLAISEALFSAAAYWVLYVALEPYARRRWPQSLVAWTRLLGGRLRDPLVGGHLLVGIAFGTVFAVLSVLVMLADPLLLRSFSAITFPGMQIGAGAAVSEVAAIFRRTITSALGFFFVFFLFRAVLRRQWLALITFVLVFSSFALADARPLTAVCLQACSAGGILLLMIRFGLLPLLSSGIAIFILTTLPLTVNFSAWYAGYGLLPIVFVLGPALWAFHTALAGRAVFQKDFLER